MKNIIRKTNTIEKKEKKRKMKETMNDETK